jgi:hypothetical protein
LLRLGVWGPPLPWLRGGSSAFIFAGPPVLEGLRFEGVAPLAPPGAADPAADPAFPDPCLVAAFAARCFSCMSLLSAFDSCALGFAFANARCGFEPDAAGADGCMGDCAPGAIIVGEFGDLADPASFWRAFFGLDDISIGVE